MRSFDGDCSFSLSIKIITLFLYSSILFSDEYRISYRYTVHNATLIHQELAISPTMTKCLGKNSKSILFPYNPTNTITQTLLNHYEELLSFLSTLGIEIIATSSTQQTLYDTMTTITFKTQCFQILKQKDILKIISLK